MRAATLAIVCLLLSGVANAQTAAAPDAPATTRAAGGLRGDEAPAASQPVSPPPAAPFSPIPSDSGAAYGAAESDDPLGESGLTQCREGCARAYYMCLSTDDQSGCSQDWTSCRAACGRGQPGGFPSDK